MPAPSAPSVTTAAGTPGAAAEQAAPITTRVADAVRSLDDVAERPLAEHADLYQRVHAELQSALAEIDGA